MNESLKEIKFLEDLKDQVLIIDKFKSISYANKAAKNHFGLSNYQMLVLSWLKGLWTGILISLIVHSIFSH